MDAAAGFAVGSAYAAGALDAADAIDTARPMDAANTDNAAGAAEGNNDSDRADTETETDYLPPVISVREGIMRITLPPESGFLLRWSSVIEE
ncbi:MAG: hypothetical protein IKF16_01810 [Lachnospiraceae bacterium]|nr:hypothetical protein [Lachnospiraceae bacterium]